VYAGTLTCFDGALTFQKLRVTVGNALGPSLLAHVIMAAHSNGRPLFLPCSFFYLLPSSIFFLSSPNLSGRRLDVYHTSTHGVALVRILNAAVKCAVRSSLEMQDPKNRHLGTIAQLIISRTHTI